MRDYLLSPEHPVGRFKAAFFRSLGFTASDWPALQRALLVHAQAGDAEPDSPSAYGQKYRVRGILEGPGERSALVVSVWILRVAEEAPRLVTAFPGDRP